MIKIKEQNQKISAEIIKGSQSEDKRLQSMDIAMKSMELVRFNQRRKNNPAVMMGLMNVPTMVKSGKGDVPNNEDLKSVVESVKEQKERKKQLSMDMAYLYQPKTARVQKEEFENN